MEWKEFKLVDLCEKITVGHVGSMADRYIADGIPLLRSQNIKPYFVDYTNMMYIDRNFHEKLRKSELKAGDVAVVRTGYPGTACVIPESLGEANCSDLVIIRPGKELNPYFLSAVFNSTFGKSLVAGNVVGAAQQHFNVTAAKELKLKFPPRKLQDKIVAILSSYDDLIENNKHRIALLESMAEEIYREWFVRFRFPGYKTTEFQKGLPKEWKQKKIGDLCEIVKRGISPKYDEESTRLVINQKCIRNNQVDLSEARTHDSKVPEEKYIQYADTLINSTGVGTLGRVGIVEFLPEKITVDSHVTICRANPKKIDSIYLATTISKLQEYFELMALGSTGQVELNKSLIEATKILVPDNQVQQAFRNLIEPFFKEKQLLRDTISNLDKTKKSLLTRLISGKLSVETLNIQFPPSMLDSLRN